MGLRCLSGLCAARARGRDAAVAPDVAAGEVVTARTFNPKWIVGKTVARVEMNTFNAGGGRGVAHDPTIVFTDGSRIAFVADELEDDGYGIRVIYVRAP